MGLESPMADLANTSSVHVVVNTVAGRELQCDMPPSSRVQELKDYITSQWPDVPAPCQKLVAGSAVLGDAEALADHVLGGSSLLPLTLVVSLDEASCREMLSRYDLASRLEAVGLLQEMVGKGNRAAVEALTKCLSDPEERMRSRCAEALGSLALAGDDCVAMELTFLLEDDDAPVRAAALEALGQVATRGDRSSVAAVKVLLEDPATDVRARAAEALARLSEKGDGDTIASMSSLLEDPDDEVRERAAQAMSQLMDESCWRTAANWMLHHRDLPGASLRLWGSF